MSLAVGGSREPARRSLSAPMTARSASAGAVCLAVAVLAGLPTPVGVSAQAGTTVRLNRRDAIALAEEARNSVSVTLADGLELSLFAADPLVANPVAIDFDANGVAYVVASQRTANPVDIRRHADWVPDVHTQRTTADLRTFFQRVLAPELGDVNTWMPDLDGNGVRDFRDLQATKERVYRLEDRSGDGIADYSVVAYEGFNTDLASDVVGGVLSHDGYVYVTVAPDVWRMRDTNGDLMLDEAQSISHGYSTHVAIHGHTLSTPTIGPDGRLYWKVGDIGFDVVDRAGRRWSNPSSGAVLRADPDGSNFEVFATGLRNTQEMAFDDHGNLIAVDNDGDYAGETERVVYIPYGSDAGWRTTWQYGKYTDPSNNTYNVWTAEGLFRPRFDGQAAHIVPPIASWRAGPSGFAYNPGTALSDEWRGHFFVTSFTGNPNSSRVFAFRLDEQGAGFSFPGDREVLRGIVSPGLKFGPEGALYLTDWISGFNVTNRGRVWKIDTPSTAGSRVRREVALLLSDAYPWRIRPPARVQLRHDDQRVRRKTQLDLVRRGDVTTLLDAARDSAYPLARLHGIWGIGQLARRDRAQAALLIPLLDDRDAEVRAQAARTLGDVGYAEAADRLVGLLGDGAPRVRFFAAEALGRLRHRPAMAALVAMLAANNDADPLLRHAGSLALTGLGDATGLRALAGHSSRAVRLAAVVSLRRLRQPVVADFLGDGDERVVAEAARAINDEGGLVDALPALAQVVDRPGVTSEAILRRAINANVRVGTSEARLRLAAFAARTDLAATVRTEALAALATWDAPSRFDRVDGSYLGSLR